MKLYTQQQIQRITGRDPQTIKKYVGEEHRVRIGKRDLLKHSAINLLNQLPETRGRKKRDGRVD